MCGIAALFGLGNDLSVIDEMTDIASHRGPDDRGVQLFQGAALGHRRLSILDLTEHGHQPMASHCGRFHIVYNGEIYNYKELKRELEGKGVCFSSHSDTEVLLNAFCEWGKDCLHKLNGMFAFVIYDKEQRRFFAARDRFGIKPLYYWISPAGLIAFASEIKQFTALEGWRPRLNHQLAYDFLNWGVHDHTSGTLFSGVNQLRGGEYAQGSIGESEICPKKWYVLKTRGLKMSPDEIAKTYRELLADSIRLRLRADVSIGSCLSGGLDSSSIVCLVAKQLQSQQAAEKQKTFSACSHVERFDEKRFIDIVIEKTGHRAHFIYPDIEDLFRELDSIIWHQDEPFGSTSIFAQWEVFKLAKREQTKVLLDGQGADEQLGGYTSSYGFHFYNLYRCMRWLKLWQEMRLSRPTLGSTLPFKMLGARVLPEVVKRPLSKLYRRPARRPEWLNLNILLADDVSPFLSLERSGLKDYCQTMIASSSLPMLLHYEDRDSMASSVEARTPFLDYRLVEFVLDLPSEWLLDQGTTKRVLREAMKGILPSEILARRDKIGFATPEEVWARHPGFCHLLEQGIACSQGMVTPSVLSDFGRVFTARYWRIISFGRWMELFKVRL